MDDLLDNTFMELKRKFNIDTKFIVKYVDDIFAIVRRNDVDTILKTLNQYHPKLQFTMEPETHSRIPFLDVMIHRKNDSILLDCFVNILIFYNNVGYNYAPPHPLPIYGPLNTAHAPQIFHQPVSSYNPREHWIIEKLKKKINLFAFGKIILKLLVFKKIVKFIGVICLLLFLPKLKDFLKDDMSVDESNAESSRIITEKDELERHISKLQAVILGSITSQRST
ncbi:PREDICTED: uncharacterized protein LOC108358979 [Rhagoletis zephyria]|uniref:uncharacterized protein LOC108358979 n=1 Tax=Rhagoletis zephyria TaxID=28612 RepID=UPI0008114378|nr:PREDICTED: uncharacterized protein LOC108358979 [Rhagoletis zephyria]